MGAKFHDAFGISESKHTAACGSSSVLMLNPDAIFRSGDCFPGEVRRDSAESGNPHASRENPAATFGIEVAAGAKLLLTAAFLLVARPDPCSCDGRNSHTEVFS